MSIVLNPYSRADEWLAELAQLLPDDELHLWPDVGDPTAVEFAVAWVMPRSALQGFTNLRAILSLGAGAEQWQKPGIPEVPVVRLADPSMSDEMASYALHWVLRLQRNFDVSAAQQHQKIWEQPSYVQAGSYRVGVLGFGTIGARVAQAFLDLGYPVNAWSRSGGSTDGVTHYAGTDELDGFLANSDAVVNILPSTAATTGLLDADRLARFASDSVFVNMGRGTVIDEDALVAALDDGPLRAAVLDVTNPEPPVAESPLWTHPAVHLTPHVAGSTQVRSASRLIAENIGRIRAGEAPFPLLDRSRGY
jgi:glyoxylate/hydroxypyruvate reductase A